MPETVSPAKAGFDFINRLIQRLQHLPYVPSIRTLLLTSLGLLACLSLLMIASASIPFAQQRGMSDLAFFYRQLGYMILGLAAGYVVYKVKLKILASFELMVIGWIVTGLLLLATLIFGVDINGAKRWIDLGFGNFQPAELCKMVMIMTTAEYVVRRSADVRESVFYSFRLMIPCIPLCGLLILQPDFGSFAVIIATMLVLLFIAGSPLYQYVSVAVVAAGMLALFVITSDYRMRRISSIIDDPFNDFLGDGYQQANSLLALGRGGITGTGYGDSIQKLSYLPEAHTDFLFAITGEELGLIGSLVVILLEAVVIFSMMAISYMAFKRRQMILSYTVFGFAVMFFGQTMINILMNLGIGPTKGLTLPFFSYGGSSILISSMIIGYVLNVYENSPIIAANKESPRY